MPGTPVIAIFDAGKTNKKLLLFDEGYHLVLEECIQLPETADDDGFPCEDLSALTRWVCQSYNRIVSDNRFQLKAVNFSAYGASLVHIDERGRALTPLYNYLKPYPEGLQDQFYKAYGGKDLVSRQTASPVLGSLNSGLQLYRLKHQQPERFQTIKYSLHLPQYLSYLIGRKPATDITSVGCHTLLWDFEKKEYHEWVQREGLIPKFAPLFPSGNLLAGFREKEGYPVGVGLHDSSAALIPYLASFQEPFLLISTGTWCISLNPFNQSLLTDEELRMDCLCYLTFEGKAVKASRLFAGNEHEQQVKHLAAHFYKEVDYYKQVTFNHTLPLEKANTVLKEDCGLIKTCAFALRNLSGFATFEHAYHQLIADLVAQQVASTNLVLRGTGVKRIFLDGGFSQNPVYMHLLGMAFPGIEVFAASMAQASAIGAALAIHSVWNPEPLPTDIVALKSYRVSR